MIKPIPTRRYPKSATVGILFVLACVAALLAGCDQNEHMSPSTMIFTDAQGCEWAQPISSSSKKRWLNGEPVPIIDRTGKQVCK